MLTAWYQQIRTFPFMHTLTTSSKQFPDNGNSIQQQDFLIFDLKQQVARPSPVAETAAGSSCAMLSLTTAQRLPAITLRNL